MSADGSFAGSARLGLYPHLKTAWYWAAVVGRGRRLVMVRDHDIALPPGESLEIRGGALWSMFNCETPLDHWSMGLEAYAVALDDPTEAYRGERGDRVGLGFDLEWEAVAPAQAGSSGGHYEQSCRVHGEVLVGEEQLAIDGSGQRNHRWGVDDWWSVPAWGRAWGTLSDGAVFSVWTDGRSGYLVSPAGDLSGLGELPPELQAATAGDGLLTGGSVTVGDLSLAAVPLADAPVALPTGSGLARLARALIRYRSTDGREGAGWMEWLERP